jgi:hypothetical protein
MYRAVFALLLVLATIHPLIAQRAGGGGRPTRVPPRTFPGLNGAELPEPVPQERAQGRPILVGPVPLPSTKHQWVRIETPHFSIFSSASARLTRTIATDLERLTALLVETSPYFRISPRRTRVFLFADPRDARPYFDAARRMRVDAAGLTVRHPAGSTILIDVTMRGGTALTPRHELVHDLLGNNGRPLPLWVEEGMAEYYSNRGRPFIEHAARLRGKVRLPIEEMFGVRHNSPRSATWEFYAQSWGAVAVLIRRNPQVFQEFLRDLAGGKPSAVALQERFQMTPKELENVIRRRAGRPASSILSDKVRLDLELEPMSRAALLSELGELLARLPNRAADAERHHMAALEADALR